MERFEYTVIASPNRAEKARGAKTTADRFALTLAQVLNDMAAQGWDYVRAETLPSEERSGLTSRQTVWNNVLIFRRPLPAAATGTPVPSLPPERDDIPPQVTVPLATPDPVTGSALTGTAAPAAIEDEPQGGPTDHRPAATAP